jgi:hypothetical protein
MNGGDISWRDGALIAAGAISVITAMIHGRLLDPLIVVPLLRGSEGMRASAKALVRPLMHVSTVDWMLGGLALISTGLWIEGPGRVMIGLLVGTQLLYAAAANAWGTRGRHPGGMLMAAAIALTLGGVSGA